MFGQGQHGLHHVQAVDLFGIETREGLSQEIGLFLVVAFEANSVAGLENRFEQGADVGGRDFLALDERGGAGEPRLPAARLNGPVSHRMSFL